MSECRNDGSQIQCRAVPQGTTNIEVVTALPSKITYRPSDKKELHYEKEIHYETKYLELERKWQGCCCAYCKELNLVVFHNEPWYTIPECAGHFVFEQEV